MVVERPGIFWDPREPIPPALRRQRNQRAEDLGLPGFHAIQDQRGQARRRHRQRERLEREPRGRDPPDPWATGSSDGWHNPPHLEDFRISQREPRLPLEDIDARSQIHERPAEGFLPPVSVSVDAQIIQDTAKVSITQLFVNNTANSIPKASYTFPLPHGSTVVDFSCRVGRDKILKGKVKPKDEAHQTFDAAIRRNQTAGLIDQNTAEIFTTTLGHIPANTRIKAYLSFIVLLKYRFADSEGLTTFVLPLYIAPRYGNPGEELQRALSHNAQLQKFSMQVNVLAPEKIISVTSSHTINVEIGVGARNYQTWREFVDMGQRQDPRTALVKLPEETTHLDKDFVLYIRTQAESGLEHPHACVEMHSSFENHQAVMLTIPPKFMLKNQTETHSAEILFIADRSGSMSDKIQALKSSMEFFLKGLPETIAFNIWCFGSKYTSLWPGSKPYSNASLQAALSYVSQQFASNMGGTNLLPVLKAALNARGGHSFTDVVVLTDGQVWDLDDTIKFVEQTRKSSGSRVRFFSLGIGNSVSHELVEGIAKVGGGYAEVIPTASQGGWESSVVAVLSAALTGHIGPLKIELDQQPTVEQTGIASQERYFHQPSQNVATGSKMQSPADISTLSPFLRNRVFLLFENATLTSTALSGLNLKTTRTDGEEVSVFVPIKALGVNDSMIHKLGARALLGDLERNQSFIQQGSDAPERGSDVERQLVRDEGERLGCKWSLVSKWTSFVAVEEPFVADEENHDPFMDVEEPQIERVDQSNLDLLRPRGVRGNIGANLVEAAVNLVESDENDDDDSSSESSTPGGPGNHRDDDDDDDDDDSSFHGGGNAGFDERPSQTDPSNHDNNPDNGPNPDAGSDNRGSSPSEIQIALMQHSQVDFWSGLTVDEHPFYQLGIPNTHRPVEPFPLAPSDSFTRTRLRSRSRSGSDSRSPFLAASQSRYESGKGAIPLAPPRPKGGATGSPPWIHASGKPALKKLSPVLTAPEARRQDQPSRFSIPDRDADSKKAKDADEKGFEKNIWANDYEYDSNPYSKKPNKKYVALELPPSKRKDGDGVRDISGRSTAPSNNLPASSALIGNERNASKSAEDKAKEDLVRKILAFQLYDGAIDWTRPLGNSGYIQKHDLPKLQDILGTDFERAVHELELVLNLVLISVGDGTAVKKIGLTAAVVAVLRKQFSACQGLWQRMDDKAINFIKQKAPLNDVSLILLHATSHIKGVNIPFDIPAQPEVAGQDFLQQPTTRWSTRISARRVAEVAATKSSAAGGGFSNIQQTQAISAGTDNDLMELDIQTGLLDETSPISHSTGTKTLSNRTLPIPWGSSELSSTMKESSDISPLDETARQRWWRADSFDSFDMGNIRSPALVPDGGTPAPTPAPGPVLLDIAPLED